MRLRVASTIAIAITCLACDDTTSPIGFAGTYVYTSHEIVPRLTGNASRPVFPDANMLVLDSLQDTIILNSDYTYREIGGVWGLGVIEPQEFLIDGHGTFTVEGENITLVANGGATVKGGAGTLKRKMLTFERDSIRWTFSKK